MDACSRFIGGGCCSLLRLSHVQLGSVESAVSVWANFLEKDGYLSAQFSAFIHSVTFILPSGISFFVNKLRLDGCVRVFT